MVGALECRQSTQVSSISRIFAAYMKKWTLILAICAWLPSCKREEKERKQIEDYVSAHNLKGQFTSSGLYYTIDDAGSGGNPGSNSTVTVEYTGTLLNGSKFDGTTTGKPIEFGLGQVIQGWQEGIPKFQKGGKGKLIIPSALGYGKSNLPGIPRNSVLVFDVYLVNWK